MANLNFLTDEGDLVPFEGSHGSWFMNENLEMMAWTFEEFLEFFSQLEHWSTSTPEFQQEIEFELLDVLSTLWQSQLGMTKSAHNLAGWLKISNASYSQFKSIVNRRLNSSVLAEMVGLWLKAKSKKKSPESGFHRIFASTARRASFVRFIPTVLQITLDTIPRIERG